MHCITAACITLAASAPPALAQVGDSSIRVRVNNSVFRLLSLEDAETTPPFGSEWMSQTGVLISEGGYVIAVEQFAKSASSIVAIAADGRRYAGTLVASDPYSNLALFKLPEGVYRPPVRAVADSVRDGDRIYALVATADGGRHTVEALVVDAHRVIAWGDHAALPYIEIQDDKPELPIRGPVFDGAGHLVGMVVLQTGLGHKTPRALAIPVGYVERMAEDLRAWGRVRRSRIGVNVRRVPEEVAAARGLSEPTGALVAEVEPGSPAARVGILIDDIILKVDSIQIGDSADFVAAIQPIRPGTTIVLEVLRGARRQRSYVTTGEIISGAPVGQPPPEERKMLP